MSDQYATNAEFYDLFSRPLWETLAPRVAAALRDLDTAAGPLLDIGAGTGLSTVAIAAAAPAARIVAVEPSATMRAAFLSRLLAHEDLRLRVTVLPFSVAEAPLPKQLSGVVAVGSIHHFDRAGRATLWQLLARRLAPGAPVLVHVMPPDSPTVVAPARYGHASVGTLDYEAWAAAQPAGPETLRWTMTFRVLHAGTLVQERTTEMLAYALSPVEIVQEVNGAGFEAAIQGDVADHDNLPARALT